MGMGGAEEQWEPEPDRPRRPRPSSALSPSCWGRRAWPGQGPGPPAPLPGHHEVAFVAVNSGHTALPGKSSQEPRGNMQTLRREATRSCVPQGTLEVDFPASLYK